MLTSRCGTLQFIDLLVNNPPKRLKEEDGEGAIDNGLCALL